MSAVQTVHPLYASADDIYRTVDERMKEANVRLEILTPTQLHRIQAPAFPARGFHLLNQIRRLRGTSYLSNDSIPPEAVDVNGIHYLSCDAFNYHLVLVDHYERLAACVRIRWHEPGITASGLRMFESIRRMPFAINGCSAINAAIQESRIQELGVAEVSCWVTVPSYKECPAARLLPLAVWAFIQNMGGALVLEHADVSGANPTILHHTGQPLAYQGRVITPVQDHHHSRLMQILMMFSREVPLNIASLLESMQQYVSHAPRFAVV